MGRTTIGSGNYGIDYSESTLVQELVNKDKKVSSVYDFVKEGYWFKTIGEILTEKKYEKLVKENGSGSSDFPTAGYESYYTIYKGNGSLSIPGVTISSDSIVSSEAKSIEDWCSQQWESKNFQYLLTVTKWCTKRVSISGKLPPISNNGNGAIVYKVKELVVHFSKEEHANLLKERGLSSVERSWIKNISAASIDSGEDKSAARVKEWCESVAGYVFIDEKDTDDYKRTVKYCIKKEYWSELERES